MKLTFVTIRKLCLAVSLTLGLGLGNVVLGAQLIQSIEVSPNPLITGQNFTIAVTASPDVRRATATVTFRPGSRELEIPLTQQGLIWTGSGIVPSDLKHPDRARAKVKVLLFDAAGRRAKEVIHLDVDVSSISAVFAGGILTVTGDDQDNTFTVSRDAAGTILVNGGAVPVTGGVPTIANTSLIQILGLNGRDVLWWMRPAGPCRPRTS